jgi:hypothetical protein
MTGQPVKPEKITKPIQLLGAWLAGLLAIDTCFLVTAGRMQDASWHAGALVIAAIANVPLFLAAVFLLQTRFRPELQEDSYYSTYLSSKTNQLVKVTPTDAKVAAMLEQIASTEARVVQRRIEPANPEHPDLAALTFGVNRHLTDREIIQKKLLELDVLGTAYFGAEEPAQGRNVAISRKLSREYVRSIVRIARELGFESYNFFRPEEEEIDEDVLFGSYGEPEFQINA